MSGFNLPDGATHTGSDGGNDLFAVTIPPDDDGYLGRQCPDCSQTFRIHQSDYQGLPDGAELWCVYCGHRTAGTEFLTDQQQARVDAAVRAIALGLVSQSFKSLEASTRGNKFVQFRSTPYYPEPLPGINEERLRRPITCPRCSLNYAVFGEHRFCPVCGKLPPTDIAADALNAETRKLDVLADLPADTLAEIRHHGVLDRTYADTVKSVVGVIETQAKSGFLDRVPNAQTVLNGKGAVFQRLNDTADLYAQHLRIDLRRAPGVDWDEALTIWADRHVITHNDSVVDAKYVQTVPLTAYEVGQRLIVKEADARRAIAIAKALSTTIG